MIIILLIIIAFILWKIYSQEEGTTSKATEEIILRDLEKRMRA
ncbi:hypothetical protein SapgrDRAFT_3212 [Saprospira grandis DSM 2844]|uniref:Uncharacterized protein n=1 Tax=Saprospira grandis DSM 2844 TaxID=694433 RepID=J0PB28_9BACT|nr:hypothetical protein [Saprospira grandis]EJF54857.1 hypothetical protein SapgrDRAFT_3212 [Saprospira grandis DSM 2844]